MKASEWIMGFAAVGTWLVAILAVFGEWVKSRLFRPKLHVQPIGLTNEIVRQNNGMDARYYHCEAFSAPGARAVLGHGPKRRSQELGNDLRPYLNRPRIPLAIAIALSQMLAKIETELSTVV